MITYWRHRSVIEMQTDKNNRLWGVVVVLLISVIAGLALWDSTPREHWIEEAVGHTGRVHSVRRTVEFTFGGGELSTAFNRYPNKFSIEFAHPGNGQTVSWHGEKNVHPILFDVIDGNPWLVVNSHLVYANPERYGCPDLPYAFLTFDANLGKWIPTASAEAPMVLKKANLSYSWGTSRTKSARDIEQRNSSDELSTGFFFSQMIPRSGAEWKYKYKKQHVTSRLSNDCRGALDKPIDVVFPKGQSPASNQVQLEILESKDFDPDWVITQDPNSKESEWGKYS